MRKIAKDDMEMRITSQFDSTDSAQAAARAVKNNTEGIVKINIISRGGHTEERHAFPDGLSATASVTASLAAFAYGTPAINSGGTAISPIIFPDTSLNELTEPDFRQSATLEIICEKSVK